MSLSIIRQTANNIIGAFQNCAKRFPMTLFFLFVFTAYCLRCSSSTDDDTTDYLLIFGYYPFIAGLLSLSLHLWGEEVKNRMLYLGISILLHLLLIWHVLWRYQQPEIYPEVALANVAIIVSIGISIFFLSFFREKNDIACWNFTVTTITSWVSISFISLMLFGCIALLLLSVNELFDIDSSGNEYAISFILSCYLLAPLIFLSQLPKGAHKHDSTPYMSNPRLIPHRFMFLQHITLRYLFLPLTMVYLVVLYAYAVRILIRWELPDGMVALPVIILMILCIGIEFGIYPMRFKEQKKSDETIARWLPLLIVPLLLLMTIGLIRRFNDYSITIRRLYVATMNFWFYLVCFGLFLTKARRINWIPISFAILFLLTSVLPINYASITRNYISQQIEKDIATTYKGELPMSEGDYLDWLMNLPEKQAETINSRFYYMKTTFGRPILSSWLQEDFIYIYKEYKYYNNIPKIRETEDGTPTIEYVKKENDTIFNDSTNNQKQ